MPRAISKINMPASGQAIGVAVTARTLHSPTTKGQTCPTVPLGPSARQSEYPPCLRVGKTMIRLG